jgi:hypothetical protein
VQDVRRPISVEDDRFHPLAWHAIIISHVSALRPSEQQ